MTCIKAHSQSVLLVNAIIDCLKLFKCPAYLASLASHCLKCNIYIIIVLVKHCIKSFDNLCGSGFNSGIDMASWMKHHYMASHGSSPYNFFFKKFNSKLISLRLNCICKIYYIRCMYNNLLNSMFLSILPASFYIKLTYFFSSCILWRTCV